MAKADGEALRGDDPWPDPKGRDEALLLAAQELQGFAKRVGRELGCFPGLVDNGAFRIPQRRAFLGMPPPRDAYRRTLPDSPLATAIRAAEWVARRVEVAQRQRVCELAAAYAQRAVRDLVKGGELLLDPDLRAAAVAASELVLRCPGAGAGVGERRVYTHLASMQRRSIEPLPRNLAFAVLRAAELPPLAASLVLIGLGLAEDVHPLKSRPPRTRRLVDTARKARTEESHTLIDLILAEAGRFPTEPFGVDGDLCRGMEPEWAAGRLLQDVLWFADLVTRDPGRRGFGAGLASVFRRASRHGVDVVEVVDWGHIGIAAWSRILDSALARGGRSSVLGPDSLTGQEPFRTLAREALSSKCALGQPALMDSALIAFLVSSLGMVHALELLRETLLDAGARKPLQELEDRARGAVIVPVSFESGRFAPLLRDSRRD